MAEYTERKDNQPQITIIKGCKDCIHVEVCRYRTDPRSKDCVLKHSSEDIAPVVHSH